MDKSVWIIITIGSTVGGAIPMLWGGGLLSSLFFGTLGAIAAIWINFRLR